MKAIFLAFCGLIILEFGDASSDTALTLNQKCAAGPTFWCKNIQNAKLCGAMTHCIKTNSWQRYPVDNDSICHICLDMVKQARDQLKSNETQEELREVFEGTCALIRIKKIREECDKLADAYEAQLIEMLTSQMDPKLVCSVAGLCNSAKIDAELVKSPMIIAVASNEGNPNGLSCKQCGKVSDLITKKFAQTDRDQFLGHLLEMCGQMSSYSDACSAIVLSYFNDIYAHLKENLNSENICHMAGVCSAQFHQHEEEIEILPNSQIGVIDNNASDDIPCDLCKQLILHLRDLLIANTTETEFKNVLEGICKQTKTFKSECLSIADQYFDEIYKTLTKELNPGAACFQIGICPKALTKAPKSPQLYKPLIPSKQLLVKTKLLGDDEPVYSTKDIQSFQLPRDVLLLDANQIQSHVIQRKGNQFCTLCEYFLHFVQDALASPSNEEAIKNAVLNTCHRLPNELQGQCQNFVNMYGDAVIALLIQDIDPSEICPKLAVCVRKTATTNEKCPLCLFLVQDLVELVKRDRSKENIENKLHLLCSRLREDLRAECIDFVNTYTAELVDKLANDFTPRDICLYLKLCTEKEEILIEHIGSHSDYNDYTLDTVYEIEDERSSSDCFICEKVIKEVENKIANDKSKDHIKKVLEQACSDLPGARLKQKCKTAIEKNSDFIVDLIIKEVTPKEVCFALGFCVFEPPKVVEIVPLESESPPCRLCQIVVAKIEETLNNKTAQKDVENCVKHVCLDLPRKLRPKCRQFIDKYAAEIVKHFPTTSPKKLCTDACVCKPNELQEEESFEEDVDESSSPECVLCENLVNKVEGKIRNNKTKDHIKEVLKQVCSSFRKENLKKKCNEVVSDKLDYIIKELTKNTSPKEICEGLGFCDKKRPEVNKDIEHIAEHLMNKYTETPQCVLCELVMTELEANLKKNSTQDDIERTVRTICSTFPAKLSGKCKKFIDDYAELIISMATTVPPHKLCGELNMCLSKWKRDTSHRDILECGICNTAVDALSVVLAKNGPKDRDTVSETTCHLLPGRYYQTCVDFMKIYVESLSNLLKRNEKRSDICVQVGKCFRNGDNSMFVEIHQGLTKSFEIDDSSESIESNELRYDTKEKTTHKMGLIGASPCTFGPSYWCSSQQTIEECNAHAFCKNQAKRP